VEGQLSSKSCIQANFAATALERSKSASICDGANVPQKQMFTRMPMPILNTRSAIHMVRDDPSSWSQSSLKRLFDFLCVLLAFPLVVPISIVVALAVRLTSSGPVLFLQKRVGCHGRIFTIVKFRTMTYSEDSEHHAITTTENQQFTPIGPFLRRCKLDELPQLLNVLAGDMSLVGARPKLPEHQIEDLQCRPGITGAATIAFAHEARFLARVPAHSLDDYYRTVVLPTKSRLDVEYMAHATFLSDLKLLVNTLLCRWDGSAIESLLNASASAIEDRKMPVQAVTSHHMSMMARDKDLASAEESTES
jgi:lipopolysaccharide/colanic/teichoic acid biosynthesis glycosyltransferase